MEFNSKIEAENAIQFVKDYYQKNNVKGAIVGISGGKDSAVVAAILVRALGKENVFGVLMPCQKISDEDMKDAKDFCEWLGIEYINYDLTKTFETFKSELKVAHNEDDIKQSDINFKPRLRMATLYYLAAMYSSIKNGTYLVAGTSNKSELYVGYFTKGGDQVHDFEVISDFTVSEVIKVGEYLGVPEKILYKVPSDGLSGKTDEDNMGITYDAIEKYIYGKELPMEQAEKIKKLHDANKHKFNMPKYERKKIGVFVGTFDPVHKGHTHIINYLLENKIVDKILLIPTGAYWDKRNLTDAKHRIAMLKIFENENVEVCDKYIENEYTYEILEDLSKTYSADKLYLIMGGDNALKLDEWKNINEILEYNIIILNRGNIDIREHIEKLNKKDNIKIIQNFDFVDTSSTAIRQGLDNEHLDDKVSQYIRENNLYKKT